MTPLTPLTLPHPGGDGRRVRWGLVGCGWLARDYVAPSIHESRNGMLTMCCDPDEDAGDAVQGYGPDHVLTLEEMLSVWSHKFDAVYIATPNHLHASGAIAAAEAGKHVLCEKPTAMDAAGAERMIDACRGAGVLFATAYDQRFHAAHMRLREIIAAGELGTVTTIRIRYACWTGRDWSPDDRPHDNWRVDPGRAGGGAVMDLAPHGLDLAQTLLGERLVDVRCLMQRRVHADVDVDDGGVIVARSESGVLLDLSVAYNCPETFPRRRLEVVGTRAMAVLTDTMGQTPGGRFRLIDAGDGTSRDIDFSGEDRSPFRNQMEAFADAVLGVTRWPFPPERDLHTMRLLDRCRWTASEREAAERGSGTFSPPTR